MYLGHNMRPYMTYLPETEMAVDVVFNKPHPNHYRKSHKIQSYSTGSRRKTIELYRNFCGENIFRTRGEYISYSA